MKPRLGYACINTYLRGRHIFCSRTAREATIHQKNLEASGNGIEYIKELFRKNLEDLMSVLEWNERNGVRLFRMSSEIAPHLSNPTFILKKHWGDMRKLAYSLAPFAGMLKKIGAYARKHGHRLTFHPGQYVVIGTPDLKSSGSSSKGGVFVRSARELYMHARIMDIMGLSRDSVIVVHGGGVYCDKAGTMLRWARNFGKLPIEVKRRLVLENDETCYNTSDVLELSASLPKFRGCGAKYKIPVVFDIFHYKCYNATIARRNFSSRECSAKARRQGDESYCDSPMAKPQLSIPELLPDIIQSWGRRRIKMHLSEQGRSRVLGKHSYLVKTIPSWALRFPGVYGRELDIMIEAKGKERAVLGLRKKYGSKVC